MEELLARLERGETLIGVSKDGWKYNAVIDLPAFKVLKVCGIAPSGECAAVASLNLNDFPHVYKDIVWN